MAAERTPEALSIMTIGPARGIRHARPGALYLRGGKRLFDLACGILLLAAAAPLMLVVALTVLVSSGWPLLYASERYGRGGRRFWMWKFRTMVRDADEVLERWRRTHPQLALEYRRSYKLHDDPRITPLGRFLRRTSLDELPQIINVIRGDMSLVGPRPYLPTLPPDAGSMQTILSVRPGITGPFQVGGRNRLSPNERMALDERYAAAVTLREDCALIARTVGPLLKRDGA